MSFEKMDPLGWIKLMLAGALLLCLAKMPYGYYNLVRFASMIGFGILAYNYYHEERKPLAITFGSLALLFQPFLKISLSRDIWQLVDFGVAIFLLILLVKNKEILITRKKEEITND